MYGTNIENKQEYSRNFKRFKEEIDIPLKSQNFLEEVADLKPESDFSKFSRMNFGERRVLEG